jgi:sn-glycerol 3-phosphate transport system ATP-binding protein/multiple sugar transport system ATP-binding protein
MKDGHLLQFDRPDVIYDRPRNRFVASFLGTPPINFVAAEKLPDWRGSQGLTAGLRPETLAVHGEKPQQAALPARLVLSEMTGAEMLLHCESAAGRLTVAAPRQDLPKNGTQFWISYDLDHALFFDSQTGERVDIASAA